MEKSGMNGVNGGGGYGPGAAGGQSAAAETMTNSATVAAFR